MPDDIIVENCSPTLAGLKTANLFMVDDSQEENITRGLRDLNSLLTEKGLRAIPVGQTCRGTLVYLYRPDRLSRDLNTAEARDILREKGYRGETTEECVVELISRISSAKTFPHEIGLFLGYPPVDVRGFMEDTRKGVKCVGYWKVYGDKEKAEKTFCTYKKCTEVYKRILGEGVPLSKMIV